MQQDKDCYHLQTKNKISKTVRNKNPISKSISILNSKKNYHYSKINKTIAGNETNNTNDVNAIQNK